MPRRRLQPPFEVVLISREQIGTVTKTVTRVGPYTFHTTVTVGPETINLADVEQFVADCIVRRWPEIRRQLMAEAQEPGEGGHGEERAGETP